MLLIWKIIKIKQLVLYEDTSIQPVRQAGFSGDITGWMFILPQVQDRSFFWIR